jgi:drug/metabolite transporter (DMT)-like permease
MDALPVIFGIVTMACFGLGNAIYKIPAASVPPKKLVLLRGIITSAILLCAVAILPNSALFSVPYIALMAGISLLGYFALLALSGALAKGDIGVVMPIANSSVFFTVLFAVIFFGETLSLAQGLGVAAIIAGIILVSNSFAPGSGKAMAKGAGLALLTCVLWGAVFFLLKMPAVAIGPVFTAFLLELFQMAFAALHLKIGNEGFALPNASTMKYIAAAAALIAIGGLAYELGIVAGSVSVVSAISMSSPVISAICGRLIFRERLAGWQCLGIAAIVLGNVLVSGII